MEVLKEVGTIERCKKTYELTPEQFFEGKWLEELRKVFNYDSFDALYKGGVLIVRFYKKTKKDD